MLPFKNVCVHCSLHILDFTDMFDSTILMIQYLQYNYNVQPWEMCNLEDMYKQNMPMLYWI